MTRHDLEIRLKEYERIFGVPSSHMVEAFTHNGELVETEDFIDWSLLYGALQAYGTQ